MWPTGLFNIDWISRDGIGITGSTTFYELGGGAPLAVSFWPLNETNEIFIDYEFKFNWFSGLVDTLC